MKGYLKLHANCIPVKGYEEGVIYDLQRNTQYSIPNLLIDILEELQIKSIDDYLLSIEADDRTTIVEYIDYLIDSELAFELDKDEIEMFPNLDLSWQSPDEITNAIIECSPVTNSKIQLLIDQLITLGCQHLLIVIKDINSLEIIKEIADYTLKSTITSIEFEIHNFQSNKLEELSGIIRENGRIKMLYLFVKEEGKAPYNDRIKFISKSDKKQVVNFINNVTFFTEAQKHNTGLNRKICIDENGNIKNYITHEKSFGHINDHSLAEIINTPEFQEKWFMSNDKIEKCKDCQYRYTCFSNSDIKKSEENNYYMVENCGFDPYKNQWN